MSAYDNIYSSRLHVPNIIIYLRKSCYLYNTKFIESHFNASYSYSVDNTMSAYYIRPAG